MCNSHHEVWALKGDFCGSFCGFFKAEHDQKVQIFTCKPWVRKHETGDVTCRTTFLSEKCRFLSRAAHSERFVCTEDREVTVGSTGGKILVLSKASEVLPESYRIKLKY